MSESKDLIKRKIATSEITESDLKKIKKDLRFIELMTQLAKEKGCRLIVSGGYAVDGNLGQLTRPHNDIDIQIYGDSEDSKDIVGELLREVKEKDPQFSQVESKDNGRQEYYHAFIAQGEGLGSDIYYIQVTGNPFDDEKHIVKKDGSIGERQHYHTLQVTLEGVTFEANDPITELADKRYKREIRGDEPKAYHNQDIKNLKLITDEKEVNSKLATMKK